MAERMSIKELADALGVSKTAVRKYMTEEFRGEHTETNRNGVITIDSDGCKLIAMHLGRTEKLTESTENKVPETEESSENLVIPRVVWNTLQEQLKAKDLQIDNLTRLIDQEQHLHAGSLQKALPESSAPSEGFQDPVELVQDEDSQKAAQEPSEAQDGLQTALRGLSFGERLRLLFGGKEK